MTKEEITAKSQEKVKAVSTLCEQLKLVVSAEQMITQEGFIKEVVYYTDSENYDVDKKPEDTVIEKEPEAVEVQPNKEKNESPILEP